MSWAEVLLVIVSYCGSGLTADLKKTARDDCRTQRVECVKKAVAANSGKDNAVEIIDACLSSPNAFEKFKITPIAAPSPMVSGTPNAVAIPAATK